MDSLHDHTLLKSDMLEDYHIFMKDAALQQKTSLEHGNKWFYKYSSLRYVECLTHLTLVVHCTKQALCLKSSWVY